MENKIAEQVRRIRRPCWCGRWRRASWPPGARSAEFRRSLGCTLAARAKTPRTVFVLPTSMTRSMVSSRFRFRLLAEIRWLSTSHLTPVYFSLTVPLNTVCNPCRGSHLQEPALIEAFGRSFDARSILFDANCFALHPRGILGKAPQNRFSRIGRLPATARYSRSSDFNKAASQFDARPLAARSPGAARSPATPCGKLA